jgi:hypothetical protein
MDLAVSSRVACAVASFGRDVINLRAKITRPAEQTRLKRLMRGGLQERVAVMIARNGQYRRGIMIIGRVKLRIIFARELTNLFLCLHHPVFSADTYHSGSPVMKELLDAAVQESGAHPDIVFTAHVHNYQRFTRTMDNQQFTYIVAGAGGYWRLHPMAEFMGAKVTPPFRQEDDPEVVLENYVDDTHGFMRIEIEDDLITARYIAVPRPPEPPETPPKVADLFQVKFKPNKLVR